MLRRHEPTIADVAAVAGVSPTTVSRVLNNRGYLSQATRQRVAEAMDHLHYRPNQVARALHGKSTHSVGVIVPTVALPFFGELTADLEDALAEHGYRMLVCSSMGRAEREREYLDLLISHRVDGVICGAHNEHLPEYRDIRMPLVSVDRDLSPAVPNVRCDNREGGRVVTQHLLDVGARRPLLLTSRSGRHNLREAGYREVLARAGIEPQVLAIDFHTPDAERSRRIGAYLQAHRHEVDAVFATDDLSATMVLSWASQEAVSVPGELKIAGFDGTAALRRALPYLTTYRQPLREIAHEAVEVLVSLMEGPVGAEDTAAQPQDDDAAPLVRELPGQLLVGTTTSDQPGGEGE